MKAIRLYAYGGPENLKYEEDAPEPTNLRPGAAIRADGRDFAVCGSRTSNSEALARQHSKTAESAQ